jgi:hypothetical protein
MPKFQGSVVRILELGVQILRRNSDATKKEFRRPTLIEKYKSPRAIVNLTALKSPLSYCVPSCVPNEYVNEARRQR